MKISIAKPPQFTQFQAVELKNLDEMAELCLHNNFSPAIFKDGYRNRENFLEAYCLGMDIDNDARTAKMTLEEAKEAFKDYSHLILPSRSHQKEKNGTIADRFRVILLLSSPITDADTWYSTWYWCKEKWPAIDPQCKDPSRFYYQHTSLASIKKGGLRVEPVPPKPVEAKPKVDLSTLQPGDRGKLGNATLKFLVDGADQGNRNGSTFKAAKDHQQNRYTLEETEQRIVDALTRTGTITNDFPEQEALAAIHSAFRSDPRHDPRIRQKAFNLQPLGTLYKNRRKLDWIVENLLTVGGVSLMSSDPKAGKSTLVRQLMRDISRGGQFLGRQCKQGLIHYYAIEEQAEVLNESFQRLGLTENDKVFVHVGDALAETKFDDFREILLSERPILAVIDTLFDFVDVESENSYKEVKHELRRIRQLARESGTHILAVHHNSKGQKDDKRRGNRGILGSQAIAGGVDTIMVIEVDGQSRLISSSGREIKAWNNREIIFDFNTRTYSLGAEMKDEF